MEPWERQQSHGRDTADIGRADIAWQKRPTGSTESRCIIVLLFLKDRNSSNYLISELVALIIMPEPDAWDDDGLQAHDAAEHRGEWVPDKITAEIRGLLADSPALSPRLSAWLGSLDEPNEFSRHMSSDDGRDEGQKTLQVALSKDDGGDVELQPWSSKAANGETASDDEFVVRNEGTRWEASGDWMSKVFSILGADNETKHLRNARLVSRGWARHIMSMKASIEFSMAELDRRIAYQRVVVPDIESFVQGLCGRVSCMIGRNRFSGLQTLVIDEYSFWTIGLLRVPVDRLLTAACGGCPLLRTLKLKLSYSMFSTHVAALQPLLPRLHCLHLRGPLDFAVSVTKLGDMMSSMISLNDLHLSHMGPKLRHPDALPGQLLAFLPKGLSRLFIDNVTFSSGQGISDLPCSRQLTDLTINCCISSSFYPHYIVLR